MFNFLKRYFFKPKKHDDEISNFLANVKEITARDIPDHKWREPAIPGVRDVKGRTQKMKFIKQ